MSPREDWPRCEHRPKANRVTNLPEGVQWEPGMEHASHWACAERACVLDSMAWCERVTGQSAYVIGPLSALGEQP